MIPGKPGWSYHQDVKRLAQHLAAFPPLLQDTALALALTVIDIATLLPYSAQLRPLGLALGLVAVETLPLALRRRWPLPTFFVIGTARLTYDLVGLSFAPVPLGPAIAYFTVIERCRPLTRRVVTCLLTAGMIASQLPPGHNEPYDIAVSALIFLTAWMAGTLSRTRSAYVAEVEARAARAEADRDAQAARAAAAERGRIARELHDVVAHHVSLMAVQSEAVGSLLPHRPADAAKLVEVIGSTARQALTELRKLLSVLRGPGDSTDLAPVASLAELGTVLDQVRHAGLTVDYRVEGTACPLTPGTDLTAYRIIQEALTNTMRHSGASRAAVSLCYEPGFVTVAVTDAGPALLPPAVNGSGTRPAPAGSGFGLAGIAERVASCGGTLTFGPAAGGAFGVTARLPAP